jgi:hypothetical protein
LLLSIFFPPGGLNPVRDGGQGDEDAVVRPQVPGGGLVGHAVLGDPADSQVLDPAGGRALGHGQVRQVSREVAAAVAAVMLGQGNNQVDGAAGPGVAQGLRILFLSGNLDK